MITWLNRPDTREAALYYQGVARQAFIRKDFETARRVYLRCINAWKLAVIDFPSLKRNHIHAQAEYLRFVRSDYVYQKVLPQVLDFLHKRSPVSETELCRELGGYDSAMLDYVLFFAERNGEISRRKRGNEYELRPGSRRRGQRGKFLAPVLESLFRPR